MRILYGVQATGQGHISRARAMARALARRNIDVTWLFSGRARAQMCGVEPFGNFQHRRGLTFAAHRGGISYLRTLTSNNLARLVRDIRELDTSSYDVIITDFEPVTAWAGKLAGIKTIGIGHQYAFGAGTPTARGHWLARGIMRQFAPVDTALGLHWFPYAANVLPPILDLPELPLHSQGPVLVYLPFEDQKDVTRWLQQFPGYRFKQYAAGLVAGEDQNVTLGPTSIDAFKIDLAASAGVICNSGFELISECLQWHKPVLTKPLTGQVEQLSNALALSQLGYARVIHRLCSATLGAWLHHPGRSPGLHFCDVADALARWLATGADGCAGLLARSMWQQASLPARRSGCPTSRGETVGADHRLMAAATCRAGAPSCEY